MKHFLIHKSRDYRQPSEDDKLLKIVFGRILPANLPGSVDDHHGGRAVMEYNGYDEESCR